MGAQHETVGMLRSSLPRINRLADGADLNLSSYLLTLSPQRCFRHPKHSGMKQREISLEKWETSVGEGESLLSSTHWAAQEIRRPALDLVRKAKSTLRLQRVGGKLR